MNKEYYQAKADLCRKLFIQNATEGDSKAEARPYAPEIDDLIKMEEEASE